MTTQAIASVTGNVIVVDFGGHRGITGCVPADVSSRRLSPVSPLNPRHPAVMGAAQRAGISVDRFTELRNRRRNLADPVVAFLPCPRVPDDVA